MAVLSHAHSRTAAGRRGGRPGRRCCTTCCPQSRDRAGEQRRAGKRDDDHAHKHQAVSPEQLLVALTLVPDIRTQVNQAEVRPIERSRWTAGPTCERIGNRDGAQPRYSIPQLYRCGTAPGGRSPSMPRPDPSLVDLGGAWAAQATAVATRSPVNLEDHGSAATVAARHDIQRHRLRADQHKPHQT